MLLLWHIGDDSIAESKVATLQTEACGEKACHPEPFASPSLRSGLRLTEGKLREGSGSTESPDPANGFQISS